MLDKEACCLVSQAIYEDLVLSFCNQGLLRSHLGPRVNQSHQVFSICRFPSELRTLQNHKDLLVISEDDLEPIHTALAGTQYILVVLFQVQTHTQEKIIQLYQDAQKLSFVCLFHECFVNAVCLDLITAVCTALRRHLGRVHCISKYQDFAYAPFGQTKKVTKSIYFILLHSSFTTSGFETILPNLEYAETWLCNSAILTSTVQERKKSMSGVVRFRVHRTGIQPLIPCTIKDHQGVDRILQYKQPDVFTDLQMSNVHVKEMRADHHIISQAKGTNQHARISAFIPFPRNELSRRRFSRVRSINVCVNRNDSLCTILDEAVPVCLVNHELAIHEAACLLEFLIHKQPILNHHSAFLSCSLNCPEQSSQGEVLQDSLLKLPNFSSIVHCHLNYNQTLTIHQPRFEDGQVSRCISNSLQLVVYERTDIIFFLTGQIAIFDLFEAAPKGRVLAIWKVPDNGIPAHHASNPTDLSTLGPDFTTKEFASSRVKARPSSKLQSAEQKCPGAGRQTQQVAFSPQQLTSPAAGVNEDIAKYETSPIQSSLEYHRRLQGTTPTKRMHSSIKGCRPCRRPRFSGPAFPPLVGNASLATL